MTVMPFGFGDLDHRRSDCAGRRGDEHDIALLRLRDVEQPEISGRSGHAEHAEEALGLDAEVGQLVRPSRAGTTASSRQPAMCWTKSPGAKPSALLSTTSPTAPPSIGSPSWNGGT